MKFHVGKILKELNLTKQDVIDWAKREIPHVVHNQDFWDLRSLKKSTITWSTVKFKYLLMFYLSDHNFVVTGDQRVMSRSEHTAYKNKLLKKEVEGNV